MEEILAVTNTTEVVVKIRLEKNSDPYGPITPTLPVQRSTN